MHISKGSENTGGGVKLAPERGWGFFRQGSAGCTSGKATQHGLLRVNSGNCGKNPVSPESWIPGSALALSTCVTLG